MHPLKNYDQSHSKLQKIRKFLVAHAKKYAEGSWMQLAAQEMARSTDLALQFFCCELSKILKFCASGHSRYLRKMQGLAYETGQASIYVLTMET